MVVDLDDLNSWPHGLINSIEPLLPEINSELQSSNAFDLSDEKWFKSSPPNPTTSAAQELICEAMIDREIRVFHATRLIDPTTIRAEGLRSLELKSHLRMIRAGLVKILNIAEIEDMDRAIASIDLTSNFFSVREGQVWFTPLRRNLHDGGCEVFFNNYGGEAIQRIANMATATMVSAIRKLGMPFVVVARIPAFGCCHFGDSRLAPTMLQRIKETRTGHNATSIGWDVLIRKTIPKEWIEDVLPREDHSL